MNVHGKLTLDGEPVEFISLDYTRTGPEGEEPGEIRIYLTTPTEIRFVRRQTLADLKRIRRDGEE